MSWYSVCCEKRRQAKMDELDILFWLEPLVTTPLVWREVGSAGGIRANTALRDADDKPIEYLNLVTAIAASHGHAMHSGEYHTAATAVGMPPDITSVLVRAGDNNLPESHEQFPVLARLVSFLTHGGNLLKD